MNIRLAISDIDRAAVYRLRYELYVEGQGIFMNEANHERRWLCDEYDAHSHLWVAEVDGTVVGTIRGTWARDVPFSDDFRNTYEIDGFRGVVDERDIIVGTRLLVRPEHRGSDLAARLFQELVEFAAGEGVALILGNCEPHLVDHYLHFGCQPYGRLHNHATNGILVPVMRIVSQDVAVRSMLAELGERAAVQCEKVRGRESFRAEVDRRRGPGGLLDELPRDDAGALLSRSLIIDCEPGQMLIGQEHASRTVYILLSGAVEVFEHGARVARMDQSGALVGEVAFLTASRRICDVVVGPEGAQVIALNNRTLHKLTACHSAVAARFMHFVARQLCEKLLDRRPRDARRMHNMQIMEYR